MGKTPLSVIQVKRILLQMMDEWLAISYHLTQRNCVHFAEEFCRALEVPNVFPDWTKGVAEFTNRYAPLRNVVSYGWNAAKNWMISRSQQRMESEACLGNDTLDSSPTRRPSLPDDIADEDPLTQDF